MEQEHIYDKHFYRRDFDGVSLFRSHISLPGIFVTLKAKLKEGILKEEVENSAKRSRRLVYYCTFDFPVGAFQIDVDVDIMKPVVWKWYAPPQNAVIIFVVVFYPRWL